MSEETVTEEVLKFDSSNFFVVEKLSKKCITRSLNNYGNI